MTNAELLEATLAAKKRRLSGNMLVALLLIEEEPRILEEIRATLEISSAAVTRIADELYLRSYATRTRPQHADRRTWQLTISLKGAAALEAILRP